MGKDKIKIKQIAKRTTDGGVTPIIMGADCDICNGLYEKKIYLTHVAELTIEMAGEKVQIDVCKTCLCNIINEIDKRILEDD